MGRAKAGAIVTPATACLPVLARVLEIYARDRRNPVTRMVVHTCALVIRDGDVRHIRNLPAELHGALANVFPAAREWVSGVPCPGSDEAPVPMEFGAEWQALLEQTREGGRDAA